MFYRLGPPLYTMSLLHTSGTNIVNVLARLSA